WRALLRQLSIGSGASETSCAYKLRDLRYISEQELDQAKSEDTRYGRLGQLEDNLDHLLLGRTMAAVEAHLITPRKGLEILHPVWRDSTPRETGYEQKDIEHMLRNLVSLG
ncbi:hypothetical protein IIA16_02915, partial [bacterium]|nr:hypothetical protein [bacterium]